MPVVVAWHVVLIFRCVHLQEALLDASDVYSLLCFLHAEVTQHLDGDDSACPLPNADAGRT